MKRAVSAIIVLLMMLLVCAGAEEPGASVTRFIAAELTENSSVRELVIPEGIRRIEEEAFADTGLEQVTLPVSLEYIADNAFDPDVSFSVYKDSAAEQWAAANGRYYTVIGEEQEDLLEVLEFEPDTDDERGRLIITEYTGTASALVLPDEIGGVEIYRIGTDAFRDNVTVRSIRFPAGLERIDNRAFYNSQIETAVLPDSVVSLGGFAFAECKALTAVVLPGNLESVSQAPFINCTALREVTMSVSFQSGEAGFIGCENVELIHYLPGAQGVFGLKVGNSGKYLEYQSKRSLKSLDFGEEITAIQNEAFKNDFYDNENDCFVLERIHLPSTLKTIDDTAFSGLVCLTEVNLPEGLEILGSEAFSHCRSLVPPQMPSTVTVLGNDVFYDCREPDPEEEPET